MSFFLLVFFCLFFRQLPGIKITSMYYGLCLKQHPGKSNYCLCYKPLYIIRYIVYIYYVTCYIYILWYMLSIHLLPFFLHSDYLVCATNHLLPPLYSSSSNLSLASFSIIKAKKGLKKAVLLDIHQIQRKNATFSQKTYRKIWWNGIFVVLLHPLSRTPPRWLFKRQQKDRDL